MESTFLKLPIFPEKLMTPGKKNRVSLNESIRSHIDLILVTTIGEHKFDPAYGFALWSYDFEMLTTRMWKDEMAKSLEEALNQYEERLEQIKINIEVKEVESVFRKVQHIRKKMFVEIRSKIRQTGNSFEYSTAFFISPLDK